MSSFKKALVLSLLAVLTRSEARSGTPSSPQDLFANPKYAVEFYNERPVAKSLAARWVEQDERMEGWGGMDEHGTKGSLIQMRFAPNGRREETFICLVPPPAESSSASTRTAEIAPAHEEHRIDPIKGWQALSHLDGKCIYSKQGWFTYAYCHNSHIRQFRAAKHSLPHPPSGYIPEEDGEYDAYTLGRATPPPGSNQAAKRSETPALSFGHSHSSRYLLQRMSSGTMCDKTGRPRETEIQFHCSMTHSDSIYLVKELATCSYVLVIHSPHLCELPGFKPETAVGQVESVKCRPVVGDDEAVPVMESGKASRYPLGMKVQRPSLPAPPSPPIRKVTRKPSRDQKQAQPAPVKIPENDKLEALEDKLMRSEAALERLIELLHLGPGAAGEVELTSLLEDTVGGELVSDEERDEVAEGSKLELLRSLLASIDANIEIRIEDEEEIDEEDEARVRDEL